MRNPICLAIVLVLAVPAVAGVAPRDAVKPGARLTFPGDMGAAPSDLHSSNLLGDCSGAEFCCELDGDPTCDDLPGNYVGGDTACFSDYWTDIVDVEMDWNVNWTHAYLLPSGALLPILINEPIAYGVLPPATYTFCVGYSITLPSGPPGGADIDTGFLVTSPTGQGGPQVTGAFTLNP